MIVKLRHRSQLYVIFLPVRPRRMNSTIRFQSHIYNVNRSAARNIPHRQYVSATRFISGRKFTYIELFWLRNYSTYSFTRSFSLPNRSPLSTHCPCPTPLLLSPSGITSTSTVGASNGISRPTIHGNSTAYRALILLHNRSLCDHVYFEHKNRQGILLDVVHRGDA